MLSALNHNQSVEIETFPDSIEMARSDSRKIGQQYTFFLHSKLGRWFLIMNVFFHSCLAVCEKNIWTKDVARRSQTYAILFGTFTTNSTIFYKVLNTLNQRHNWNVIMCSFVNWCLPPFSLHVALGRSFVCVHKSNDSDHWCSDAFCATGDDNNKNNSGPQCVWEFD